MLEAYSWLMLLGILASLWLWVRLAKGDRQLLYIYLAALTGGFIGAKLAYIFAEGWADFDKPGFWMRWATGKSILGALPGGYLGVELAKRALNYRRITGDWFASVAPIGIILGRAGCWHHGCCAGRIMEPSWFTMEDPTGPSRWPAVPVEILFNAGMLAVFFYLRGERKLIGQHFHIYLIAYGAFRFVHEFVRETPLWFGLISGYQIAALVIAGFGIAAFTARARVKETLVSPRSEERSHEGRRS